MTGAVGEMVDGVAEGEVRSATGEKGLLHQHDDGFACVRSSGTPQRHLIGSPRYPAAFQGCQEVQNGSTAA